MHNWYWQHTRRQRGLIAAGAFVAIYSIVLIVKYLLS